MIKNKKCNCRRKLGIHKPMKHYLIVVGFLLIVTALIVSFSLTAVISSAEPTNMAGSETQFSFNVAYAYVGKCSANASYIDSNGRSNVACQSVSFHSRL